MGRDAFARSRPFFLFHDEEKYHDP
ncbi:hypothetical protein IL54_0428 [Sphingobium sp. ba1]|nr:hypothetical protein IL54_0428 [Sphingobium sp. ba1]